MFGIIMAGGQGTRLRPLTLTRPKPMVEVLGRPVIDYVKEAMVQAGIDSIIVTTGYRGEQLQAHVASWEHDAMEHHQRRISARINQEATPMGTAGSVGLLRGEVNQTCVVGSGDSVASFDIQRLLAQHRAHGSKVTMALWEVEDPSEFGIVGLSDHPEGDIDGELRSGFIRRFLEKPRPEEAFSRVINAGLYIIEPEVLALIPEGVKFDFSKDLFPLVLEKGWPMYAETIDGVWFDVGLPRELLRAQSTLLSEQSRLPFQLPPGEVTPDASFIHADALNRGDVHRSVISADTTLEQNARVEGSLLMARCQIKSGAVVKGSVLGQGVVVESGAYLIDCVVGDDMTVDSNAHHESVLIPDES
ncbi:MAG: NDP-sugar synthase [Candidatus Poseidonia sp.]|nr:NDP-sugar synthase [Poseidonia sp.]